MSDPRTFLTMRLWLVGLLLSVLGLAVWLIVALNGWKGAGWTELISGLLVAGTLAVVLELAVNSKRSEIALAENLDAITNSVFESLKLGKPHRELATRLSTSELDNLIASAVAARLGSERPAEQLIERLTDFDLSRATQDYSVHAALLHEREDEWVEIHLRYKYDCLLAGDLVHLRGLSADDGSRPENQVLFWLFDEDLLAGETLDPAFFSVSDFLVDGERWELMPWQSHSSLEVAARGPMPAADKFVAVEFRLEIRRRYSLGSLHLPVARPSDGVDIEFDVSRFSDAASARILTFFGSPDLHVEQSDQRLRCHTTSWVLPRSGVVLTWSASR